MKIEKLKLNDSYQVILNPRYDARGFFMRAFDDKIFAAAGLKFEWVQENHSRSERNDIIRGLHFQLPPYSETKLVRCIKGAIMDVFVDLRYNSETFGQWDMVELSESNKKMVLVPKGFAHGFCTITGESEILYKVDNYYMPEFERGLLWNDADLNIQWPVSKPFISPKDSKNMSFKAFVNEFGGLHL